MLADPRSQSLVTNFAGQWLFLRNIARIQPDPAAFPNFDDNLRDALRQETELLIESMLREDKSVGDAAGRGLHLRQSAARRALRHRGHLRQRVPARAGER